MSILPWLLVAGMTSVIVFGFWYLYKMTKKMKYLACASGINYDDLNEDYEG